MANKYKPLSGSLAKLWTEIIKLDLTKKVPNIAAIKAYKHKFKDQILSSFVFIDTLVECMRAVIKSHGIRETFSIYNTSANIISWIYWANHSF